VLICGRSLFHLSYIHARLMESEETVRVLAREMALMALDRYGLPTIDIPLQVGRCVAGSQRGRAIQWFDDGKAA
jgi:hypothetical protein